MRNEMMHRNNHIENPIWNTRVKNVVLGTKLHQFGGENRSVDIETDAILQQVVGEIQGIVMQVDEKLPQFVGEFDKIKKDTLVEWALADIHKPIGMAGYELHNILPKELVSSLPTPQELEQQLELMDKKE